MIIELQKGEEIKEIKDFPQYLITNYGRVWSLNSNKWLKPTINKRGNYQRYYVSLGRGNKRYIHRLVADAFIDNPNNYDEVDHKDANGLNNHADNLRWVTHQENLLNENTVKNIKKNTGYLVEIEEISTGKKFYGREAVCKEFNVSKETVSKHLNKKVKNPKWRLTGLRVRP